MFGSVKYYIARFCLETLMGFGFKTDAPEGLDVSKWPTKFVCIGEPHTSYLDFLFMVLVTWYMRFPSYRFMMNKMYVRWPYSPLLHWMGVIEIDTATTTPDGEVKKHNMVQTVVDESKKSDNFALLLSPTGTRGDCDHWKSGFYHIARKAEIPVMTVYMDFATKLFGYGEFYHLTGDMKVDMDYFRNFYENKVGLHVSQKKICLLQEPSSSN